MVEKNVNWSLKAWETRRKNSGNGQSVSRVKTVKSDAEREEERRWREDYRFWKAICGEKDVVKELEKLEREMVKKMRRKDLMERALGSYDNQAIYFGDGMKKRKIERWSGGVKIGD